MEILNISRVEYLEQIQTLDNIEKIPLIPPEIIKAVNEKNLSLFLGAGVSRLVGCCGWRELAKRVLHRCLLTRCIHYTQHDRLIRDRNCKKIITICHELLAQKGLEQEFYSELESAVKGKGDLLAKRNIYKELAGVPALHITTNVDQHFDSFFSPERITYKVEDFDAQRIDRYKLYHIHGSIVDRTSLVFTVPRYIQRYSDPRFQQFLFKIFQENVILFLGYGMEEYELLDFLIPKFDPMKGKERKHFILLPYYRGEEDALRLDSLYFNSLGVRIKGYEKDEHGYTQLYDIVRNWNKEIMQTSTALFDEIKEIEDAVDNL